MWIDSWGNESNTKEEAKNKILKNFRESENYFETISEILIIPTRFFEWIVNNHWNEFKKEFATEIDQAEKDWAEYYFEGLEEI